VAGPGANPARGRYPSSAVRPREGSLGEHGHSSSGFQRSLERGNVVAAELALREMRHVTLEDALAFTALVALRDRPRARRMAVRWLERWLDESPESDIEQAAVVTGLLAALGGNRHHWAVACLEDMAERAAEASRRSGRR